jgi:type IV fimbrial biogenesis protein FimT
MQALKHGGFTMMEVLIVLVVVAILTAIATPNLGSMVRTQRVKTASFDIFSSLMLARSEAIKRNATVTMTPVSSDWANGWAITDSQTPSNTLRQQPAFSSITITGPTSVAYTSSGRVNAASAPQFSLSATDVATGNQRCIKIDLSGRPVALQGACS